jgi:hypothetical protein
MQYAAPKLVLPVFNPADFNTKINTAVSSFTQEQQDEINALISANNALQTQINTATFNLGKFIYIGNRLDRYYINGNTTTQILYVQLTPGTYVVSASIPFSAYPGSTPLWTQVQLNGNTSPLGEYQTSVNYPPYPPTNAFIGSCDWVGIVATDQTIPFGLTMTISSGSINDQWAIGTEASIAFSPISAPFTQNMIRIVQIR